MVTQYLLLAIILCQAVQSRRLLFLEKFFLPLAEARVDLGCWTDDGNRMFDNSQDKYLGLDGCQTACMSAGAQYIYMAYEYSSECYCGMASDNYKAIGASNGCKNGVGGYWAANVYGIQGAGLVTDNTPALTAAPVASLEPQFTTLAPDATAAPKTVPCQSYPGWNAGWGSCNTYVPGIIKGNHFYCHTDNKFGYFASQVCSECGDCHETSKPITTLAPDASPAPKTVPCQSYPGWNAGWGSCDTYVPGIIGGNHDYCHADNKFGYFASQVCSECGDCHETSKHFWKLGNAGLNCADTCKEMGTKCVEAELWPQSSEWIMSIAYDAGVECSSTEERCDMGEAPILTSSGQCFFCNNPKHPGWGEKPKNMCTRRYGSRQRICPCKDLSDKKQYKLLTEGGSRPCEQAGLRTIVDKAECSLAAHSLGLSAEESPKVAVQSKNDRLFGCRIQLYGSPFWLNTKENPTSVPKWAQPASKIHKAICAVEAVRRA